METRDVYTENNPDSSAELSHGHAGIIHEEGLQNGHGFIGYPKGRNVERALGPSCPCVLCTSHSLGLYLLHQI